MILTIWNKDFNLHIKRFTYTNNGNLAICLLEDDRAPFATLTVNFEKLPHGYAYLDNNNCPWAVDFVEDNNLGEFTGIIKHSGFCNYPLYKFYEEERYNG